MQREPCLARSCGTHPWAGGTRRPDEPYLDDNVEMRWQDESVEDQVKVYNDSLCCCGYEVVRREAGIDRWQQS